MDLRAAANRLSSIIARAGMNALLDASRERRPARRSRAASRRTRVSYPAGREAADARGSAYAGDWRGPLPADLVWEATPDGHPDPGEIVWAWVPYEEDHANGKDRPALVIARHPSLADAVLALPLTSKDHDRDAAQEARAGRHWMDIGSGAWDRGGRPSEVRLDRVLQLDAEAVRREGAALDRAMFEEVVRAARAMRG